MHEDGWKPLLHRLSRVVLDAPKSEGLSFPPEAVEAGWLGLPPANVAQIAAAEARLGVTLPPSYRAFLRVSNGWRYLGDLRAALRPVEAIDWFRLENQDWIDAYTEPLNLPLFGAPPAEPAEPRPDEVDYRHLSGALQISDVGDSAVLLLNPAVVGSDGEWEAWFFANWVPGADRYDSFYALLEQSVASQAAINAEHEWRLSPSDPPEAVVAKLPGLIAALEERIATYRGFRSNDMGYSAATVAGLEEILARVRALAGERDPQALRAALRGLAAAPDTEAAKIEANLREQTDVTKLLGALGSLRQMLANMGGMLEGIREGGRAEGLRQGAALIRWYLGEE